MYHKWKRKNIYKMEKELRKFETENQGPYTYVCIGIHVSK